MISARPLVSVVLVTKNESKNIDTFLQSVSNQTYQNIETIVVDNYSEDNTREIAKQYTAKVYVFGPERSAQRNYGGKKAGGEYLVFLDADMELTPRVIESCLEVADKSKAPIITIPERTVGTGFMPRIRRFEREMYMGEMDYEVPRFFKRELFFEYGGYDVKLTGPEDYDLPYRMGKKYKIGRAKEYLLHHEEGLTLGKQLKKKYYYAKNGALYATKHPNLVLVQGTILFRKIYLKHWRKFLQNPLIGISFIFVRLLETIWAVTGFISAVGVLVFAKTVLRMLRK